MNCSKHSRRRYAQRIDNIPEAELDRYVTLNYEAIDKGLLKLLEYSTMVYRGQFAGDTRITANYYIKGDILLVVDVSKDTIITITRIDFGLPEDANDFAIKSLVREIQKLQSILELQKEGAIPAIESKRNEIDSVDQQLKNLREQLDLLETKKKILKDEIDAILIDQQITNKKIDMYANNLCAMTDLKREAAKYNQ